MGLFDDVLEPSQKKRGGLFDDVLATKPTRTLGQAAQDRLLGTGAAGLDMLAGGLGMMDTVARKAAPLLGPLGALAATVTDTGSAAETLRGRARAAREMQSGREQELQQGLGEAAQSGDGFLGNAAATARYLWDNPAAIGQLTDSLPASIAAGGIPGRIAAAGGATGATLTGANLGGFAATAGIQSGEAASESVLGAQARELGMLMDTPEYQGALQATGDHGKAMQLLADNARLSGAATGTAINLALLGAGQKLGLNVVEDAVAGVSRSGGRLGSAVLGGAKEAISEAPQGMADQFAQNVGERAGGLDTGLGSGLGAAAVMEAAAGAPGGVLAGAMSQDNATLGAAARAVMDVTGGVPATPQDIANDAAIVEAFNNRPLGVPAEATDDIDALLARNLPPADVIEQGLGDIVANLTPAAPASPAPSTEGAGVAATRDNPLPAERMDDAPVGAWVAGPSIPGTTPDQTVRQIIEVPINQIDATEFSSDGSIMPDKRADAARYAEAMRNGVQLPNARGAELPNGKIKLQDGHRRLAAAIENGQTTLRVAVSPMPAAEATAVPAAGAQAEALSVAPDGIAPPPPSRFSAADMRSLVGWSQRGGELVRAPVDPSLLNDEQRQGIVPVPLGEVIGRTRWTGWEGPDGQESGFWKNRPKGVTEAQANVAFDKLERGEPLTAKEQRFIDYADAVAADYDAALNVMADEARGYEQVAAQQDMAELREQLAADIAEADVAEAMSLADLYRELAQSGVDLATMTPADAEPDGEYAARLWNRLNEARNGTDQPAEAGDLAQGAGGREGREAGAGVEPAFQLGQAAAPAAAQEVAPAPSAGLFGAPSARDFIDAASRARDARRNGDPSADSRMLAGDGELFAGSRPAQAEIEANSDVRRVLEAFDVGPGQGLNLLNGVGVGKLMTALGIDKFGRGTYSPGNLPGRRGAPEYIAKEAINADPELAARARVEIAKIAADPKFLKKAAGSARMFAGARPAQASVPDEPLASVEPAERDANFKRWSKGAPIIEPDEMWTDYEGGPAVFRLFHGTTADFDAFDRSRANPESDFGAAFYFSNTPDDVGNNYAGIGPDLTQKIEREAERIAQETDRDYSDPEVVAEARKKWVQHDGATMPVFVRVLNPAIVGGPNETRLTYEEEYDEEADEYGEPGGTLVDFIEALRYEADNFSDGDVEAGIAALLEAGLDGEIAFSDVIAKLKETEEFNYFTDDNGDLASNELIRAALERAGFDGIVDYTVDQKFGSQKRIGKAMAGMSKDTVHVIAFEPTQIKSSTGNSGEFNPSNPSVLAQTETLTDADLTPAEFASMQRQSIDRKTLRETLAREQGDADADANGLREAVRKALGDSGSQVIFLRNKDGLPDDVRGPQERAAAQRGKNMRTAGLFHPASGTVYLFTDVVKTPQMAAFTASHEIAGHKGLRALLGDRLNAVLDLAEQNPTVKAVAASMTRQRNLRPDQRYLAIEEALADLAAANRTGNWQRITDKHGVQVPSTMRSKLAAMLQNVVRRIKALFGRQGVEFTDAQVLNLLENAWQAAQSDSAIGTPESALESTEGGSLDGVDLSKTKVVDKDGKPLTVFHGTTQAFDHFRDGAWFAENPDLAQAFFRRRAGAGKAIPEGARVIPVKLAINNPFDVGSFDTMKSAQEWLVQAGMGIAQADALVAANPAGGTTEWAKYVRAHYLFDNKALRSALESLGYDGLKATESQRVNKNALEGKRGGRQEWVSSTTWAAFTPQQIIQPQPLESTEDQTQSEAFKRWFGDSKVVDADGKPLVVYHGSPTLLRSNPDFWPSILRAYQSMFEHAGIPDQAPTSTQSVMRQSSVDALYRYSRKNPDWKMPNIADEYVAFDTFDVKMSGSNTESRDAKGGLYFSDDARFAEWFRVSRQYDPFTKQTTITSDPRRGGVHAAYLSLRRPLDLRRGSMDESKAAQKEAMRDLAGTVAAGYDGIINYVRMPNGKRGTEYIAFRPNQIKSATANSGAFDPTSDSILESVDYTPEQEAALTKAGLQVDRRSSLQRVSADLRERWARLREAARDSDALKQSVFDKFHGLRAAEAQVGLADPEQSPYIAARMTAGLGSNMEAIMLYGAPALDGGVLTIKPDSVGLLDALKPVEGQVDEWLGWMVGRRARLLKSQGRENNLSDTDIAALLSLADGREAEFQQAARDYLKIKNAVLDMAEAAGLIDPVARSAWDHAEYIPFYRAEDGGAVGPGTRKGLAGQTSGIRTLKGGEQALADPLANIVRNFAKLVDASLKNRAVLLAVDGLGASYFKPASREMQPATIPMDQVKKALREQGVPESTIAGMPPGALRGVQRMLSIVPPTGENVVRVMREGKAEYYEVLDPLVLRSLTAFKQPHKTLAIRPLIWFKRLLTTGVTTTAEFVGANFIRDSGSAWVISDDRFTPGWDSLKGVANTLRNDAGTREMMMAGSTFLGGSFYDADPDAAAAALRRALRTKGMANRDIEGFMGTVARSPLHLWDAWMRLSGGIENANRRAVYDAAIKAGRTKTEAAYMARDLMDFAMQGDAGWVQFFADVLPFFNARLQGMYKLGRRAGTKQGRRAMILRGGVITLASAALYAWNVLNHAEGWDELEEWDKDAYWHIAPGTAYHVRIPKPFELGLVFGTAPERMMEAIRRATTGEGDEPSATWDALVRAITGTLAINPIPQAALPIAEQWANKRFFTGRPIENMGDENLLPEARAEWYTSDAMKALGRMSGLSPKRLEHLWNGYTAGLGGYVLDSADFVVRQIEDAPERPDLRLGEMPVVGRFLRGGPGRSKYSTLFYERLREAEQIEQTVKEYVVTGKAAEAEKLEAEHAELLGPRVPSKRAKAGFLFANVKAMRQTQTEMGKIREEMEDIALSRDLSGEAKRKRLDELETRRNRMVRDAVKP